MKLKSFPASILPTAATGAIGINRDMAKLPRHSIVADHQLPIRKNAGSHTFGDCDEHRIPDSIHAREG